MKRRAKRPSADYLALEPRQLLAGDVTVVHFEGDLYVRGDGADNHIEFYSDHGVMLMRGKDTTINGVPGSVSVHVPGTRVVDGYGSSFMGGIRVHMGPGNDTIQINNTQIEDWSVIFGGTGDDSILIDHASFQDRITAQTYTGDDHLSFTSTSFHDDFYAIGLDGDDTIQVVDSVAMQHAIMTTGNGNDVITSVNNQLMGDVQWMLTNDGDDRVEMTNTDVGEHGAGIYTGDGADHVEVNLDGVTVDGQLVVSGQAGRDMGLMEIHNDHRDQVFARSFEFNGDVAYQNGTQFDYGELAFRKQNNDGEFYVANRIRLDADTNISAVEWSGAYEYSRANREDRFVVELYEATEVELPYTGSYLAPDGDPMYRFEVGDDVNRTATGQIWADQSPPREIFEYSASVDFELEANKDYFVVIVQEFEISQEDDYDNLFYWGTQAGPNNRDGAYRAFSDPTWYPSYQRNVFTLRS
ncbi:MAG: hypothetical protein AAFN77_10730 [Planctomycetota bacterium]